MDWLPMYKKSLISNEINKIGNAAANSRMSVKDYQKLISLNQKTKTDGGILFFDGLLWAQKSVFDIVMKLLDERSIGDFVLGSHWIMVCATGRPWEFGGRYVTTELAWTRRFQQVTFIPSLSDWLMWAKGYDIDPDTGEYDLANQGFPRIEQTIIDFISSAGEAAWYEVVTQAAGEYIDEAKAAKMTATPASWKFASDELLKASIRKMQKAGMSDEDIKKNVKRLAINPDTGEWELYYNGLSDAEKVEQVGLNIGVSSELTNYKNFLLNFAYYFPPKLLSNIWNYGCPYPKRPVIVIPFNVDPYTGGMADMVNLLGAHLFSHSIIPVKLSGKDNISSFTRNDIDKYIKFMKMTAAVIKYLHTYLKAAPNTPELEYQQEARRVEDFISGIMTEDGDPTKKHTYPEYRILDIYNMIINSAVIDRLKLTPEKTEDIKYSIWPIIKETNLLKYNMTLKEWASNYHVNTEAEMKDAIFGQMKDSNNKLNHGIFNKLMGIGTL